MIEWDSPDKFIGTTAAIIMGITAAASTAGSIYSASQQRNAARDASAATTAGNDKQLAFAREQAAIDQRNHDATEAENRRQFDLTQGLNLQQYRDREDRLAPYRNIGTAANGTLANLIGFTPSGAYGGGGGSSHPMPALDPTAQQKFNEIFPDETLTPDMLKARERDLNAAGFILRPNAAGVVGKVQYGSDPNAVIDVIQGAGSGLNRRQWLYGPSGGSAAAAAPGNGNNSLLSFVEPSRARVATSADPVSPALSSSLSAPYAATLRDFLSQRATA